MEFETLNAHGRLRSSVAGDEECTSQLCRAVDRAELLRIRSGQYIDLRTWLLSPPWEQFLITATAVSQALPGTIFCRETALALQGVPLLRVPRHVQIRTKDNAKVGRKAPSKMTGQASASKLTRACTDIAEAASVPVKNRSVLRGIGTQRVQFPKALRSEIRGGLAETKARGYTDELVVLSPPATRFFKHETPALAVEPMALAALEVGAQSDFEAAVVMLDAAKRGKYRSRVPLTDQDLAQWWHLLPSQRAERRFNKAWCFADAASDSPGESLFSRANRSARVRRA